MARSDIVHDRGTGNVDLRILRIVWQDGTMTVKEMRPLIERHAIFNALAEGELRQPRPNDLLVAGPQRRKAPSRVA